MKKLLCLIPMLFFITVAKTCPVCEKKQPEILKGITHGAGPQTDWDYVIVWFMVLILTTTLAFTLKWIFNPGEKSNTHIKRLVLNPDDYEDR